MQKWATVAVKPNEIGHLVVLDHESFDLHDTESAAREAVESGLRSGDDAVALMKVEGVYRIGKISLETVED